MGLTLSTLTDFMYNFNCWIYYVIQILNFFIYLGIGLYLTYTLPTEFGS